MLQYSGHQLQKQMSKMHRHYFFDKKLSWKDHTENIPIYSEIAHRFKNLKRLCTIKWGCSISTLNTTCNKYIKPVTLHCSELLLTIDRNFEQLEKVQNQALRSITGGIKTTPMETMHIIANIYAVTQRCKNKQ